MFGYFVFIFTVLSLGCSVFGCHYQPIGKTCLRNDLYCVGYYMEMQDWKMTDQIAGLEKDRSEQKAVEFAR